jgi:hypothetical protein
MASVDDPAAGRAHGAAGVCLAGPDQLVLISHDGVPWGFPAGRPERGETIEETLRREVWEGGRLAVIAVAGPHAMPIAQAMQLDSDAQQFIRHGW